MALTKFTEKLISDSFKASISGSDTSESSSFASRVTLVEGGTTSKTLVSSSAQIADDISGSLSSTAIASLGASIVSASVLSSPSQGTIRLAINGVNTDVDSGLQAGDSPTFAGGTVTGDFAVGGTLTAQEVHTEFESASILFTSGSTQFGNSSDDVHNMTGSLNVSGGIDLNDGNLIVSDKIGIGGSPSQKLDVQDTADPAQIRLKQSGNSSGLLIKNFNGNESQIVNVDNGPLVFKTNDNEVVRFKSGGNVGIGTNNPNEKLHVEGSSPAIRIKASNEGGEPELKLQSDQGDDHDDLFSIRAVASHALNILNFTGDTATSVLFISGSGHVKVPQGTLEVGDHGVAGGQIVSDGDLSIHAGFNDSSTGNGDIIFKRFGESTSAAELARFTSTGRLGIGTASPDARLKVEETTAGANVEIKMRALNDSSAGRTFSITADPDARTMTFGEVGGFHIKSDGATDKVGIGTSSPAANLEVISATDYSQIHLTDTDSNNTVQRLGIQGQHYGSSEAPIRIIGMYNSDTTSNVQIGGGSGDHNSATLVQFFTSANTTTSAGTLRMIVSSSGYVGIGTDSPEGPFHVHSPDGANYGGYTATIKNLDTTNNQGNTLYVYGGNGSSDAVLRVDTISNGTALACLGTGAVGVGLTGPNVPFHVRKAGNGKAGNIARFAQENDSDSVLMYGRGSGAYGASSADACMAVATMETSGRSINAGGTINASGADYAEYETKRADCGTIEKGDIVGFDTNGLITDKWTNAVTFGIKSTNPSYVGGDTWGVGVSSGSIETERLKVDRIAYSGKVPCNVTGSNVGDYIIPIQVGDGIGGIAKSSPTYDEYKQSVGVVRTISGSLPIVVVKTL